MSRRSILSLTPEALHKVFTEPGGEFEKEWHRDPHGRVYIALWEPGETAYSVPPFIQSMLDEEYERGKSDTQRAMQAVLGLEDSFLSQRVEEHADSLDRLAERVSAVEYEQGRRA